MSLGLHATKRWPVPAGAHVERRVTDDGTGLRAARWCPADTHRGTVVVLNGRTEYIEKYLETTSDLLARGFAVATLDWRGQGLSDRPLPDRLKGHVDDFDRYVSDLDFLIKDFVEPHCPSPYWMLAHSMGGNIGLRHLRECPGFFERAVFSAPLWGLGRRGTPAGWLRASLELCLRVGLRERSPAIGPGARDPSRYRFANNRLTGDPERFEGMLEQLRGEPRLGTGPPTFGWLHAVLASIDLVQTPGFAEAVSIPICICTPGADRVVSQATQAAVAARLPRARTHRFEGARHEILMELDIHRNAFWECVDAFTA